MKTVVKTLRICFIVLLAVLLPVRGAVAAAMLCPALTGTPQAAAQVHDHAHMDHAHMKNAAAGHAHDQASQCKLCCAFCSLTPMPAGLPALPAPAAFVAALFPEPLSPAPSFLSDGQERPPRST